MKEDKKYTELIRNEVQVRDPAEFQTGVQNLSKSQEGERLCFGGQSRAGALLPPGRDLSFWSGT